MTTRLEVDRVGISFGGLVAVNNFSMVAVSGEVHGLIGPNGAGKTTVFNLISGIYQPKSGSICLNGLSLVGMRTWEIAKAGVCRTFQTIRLFKNVSVLENVLAGLHLHGRSGILSTALRTQGYRAEDQRLRQQATRLLEQAGLVARAQEPAGVLAYGEQRRLEIARALATSPKVLLLDEPKAGMNPEETRQLSEYIRNLGQTGLAVVVIEHDMQMIMSLCNRVSVMHHGELIAEGTPAEVQRDARVVEAYLGRRDRRHA